MAVLFAAAASAEEVWISNSSGNWSDSVNWLSGVAPLPDGSTALSLRFAPSGIASTEATNDYPGSFALGSLGFDSSVRFGFKVAGGPGSSILLGGVLPEIRMLGAGMSTLALPVTLAPEAEALRFSGAGAGSLTINGAISASNAAQRLIIAGGATSPRGQVLTLSAANDIAGGVLLQSGNLALGHSGALGTGVLTIEGGTLQLTNSTVDVNNELRLNTDLVVSSSVGGTLSGPITSAVAGTGLQLRGAGAVLSLKGASAYTGATTIDYSLLAPSLQKAGTLNLTGSGSILDSSEINVRAGATLQITSPVSGTINRIGDNTPINLRHGTLLHRGPGSTNSSVQVEDVGAVSGAGYSTISVILDPGRSNTRLVAQALNRIERGTFLFTGTYLGGTFGSGVGNILFNTAPAPLVGGGGTGPNTSILPFAIGESTGGFGSEVSLVTYTDTGGIRPLNKSTEYSTNISLAAATHNVMLLTSTANSSSRTVNSLALSASGALTGSGSVTVTSGAVLNAASSGTIANALNFGPAEANIFSVSPLTISGKISGSGGLTKSGEGRLTLSAWVNDFTGPLTINAGRLGFATIAALGVDSSPVVINGHGAGLSYTGSGAVALARGVDIRTGIGRIDSTGTGRLTLTGQITGPGGVQIGLGGMQSAGVVTMGAANTYSGPTVLASGTLEISSDAMLGSGGLVNFAGGSLVLLDDWNTDREIVVSSGVVRTGAHSSSWNGIISGTGEITKLGSGTLSLNSSALLAGLSVNEGTLRLSGAGELPWATSSVGAGAVLALDNSAAAVSDRLSDERFVSLTNGDLRILGHSTESLVERIGSIKISEGTTQNSVTLLASGTASLRLELASPLDTALGELILRGSKLGAPGTGAFARLSVTGNAAPLPGLVDGVYADLESTGLPDSLVIYDERRDEAGVIGYRSLRPEEYASGSNIQNPENGGGTPANAHFLVDVGENVSAVGTNNTVESLTFAGGTVSLQGSQTLNVASGQIFVRGGLPGALLTGGAISVASGGASIYTAGDLTIQGSLAGDGRLKKSGPGTLTIAGPATYSGGTMVQSGTLRSGAENALASQQVFLHPGTALEFDNEQAQVGGLGGSGVVRIGTGTLTVGSSPTSFSFHGSLTGSGGMVIADGGNPAAVRYFSGISSFTGPVRLDSGYLSLGNGKALGTGPLIMNGGRLLVESPLSLTGHLQINKDLHVLGSSELVLDPSSSVSGSAGIILGGPVGLSVRTVMDLPSGVRSDTMASDDFLLPPGTITITINGSIKSAAGIQTRPSGSLVLTDSIITFLPPPVEGALGESTPVLLNGSTMEVLRGSSQSTIPDMFGNLTVAGFSKVRFSMTGIARFSLAPEAILRQDRGTMLLETIGTTVLGGPMGPNVAQFQSNTPPMLAGGAGTDLGIVPWAAGLSQSSTGSAYGLLTYDDKGFRMLSSAEYTTTLSTASPSSNVRVSSPVTNDSTLAINALVLNAASVTGTGSLSIASGVVLQSRGSFFLAPISNGLAFGDAEAQFFSWETPLEVSGVISGNAGLTKSGTGSLTLSAVNTFTGPITINGGGLNISSADNLGPDTTPVVLHGTGTTLHNSAVGPMTLLRTVHLAGGISTLRASQATGVFNIPDVQGPGGLRIGFGSGVVRLSGVNTYLGPTVIEGQLGIDSDAALGDGDLLIFNRDNATLRLFGSWTTARRIEMPCLSVIDTAGFDAVASGPLSGSKSFTKAGEGTFTVTDGGAYIGGTKVSAGTLVINGPWGSSVGSTVDRGGTLSGDLTTTAPFTVSGTLAPGDGVGSMELGNLILHPGSTLSLELASPDLHDQLRVRGSIFLTGNINLDLTLGFDSVPRDDPAQFTLIVNDGADPIALNPNAGFVYAGNLLNEGDLFSVGNQMFSFSYSGGTGNDVVLYTVPEPGTAAILCVMVAMLSFHVRRRP